jgi:predicted permease
MVRVSAFCDSLAQDLRYGLRMLIAKFGFTAVAVLSIALGIGATTAIFSVIHAVLIDPYPYRAADRIGWIGLSVRNGNRPVTYTEAQYLDLKSRLRSMEDTVALNLKQVVLTGTNVLPEVLSQEDCSPNMFEFYGVPALFGRVFTPADFPAGHAPEQVAVISYRFWQHALQGSRDVIGRKILLNEKQYTIIGVLPLRFTWNDVDAYTPMDMRPNTEEYVAVFFRIKPGVTERQIASEFNPLLEKFRLEVPRFFYPEGAVRAKWISVNEGILGKFATTLLVLFGAVVFLLLIACANVANLLLARAATRDGEMAIRASIGATRARLIRQMLTESVLLALTGGALGIGSAFAGVKAVIALMPEHSIPHEAVIALNWSVLWFAAAASVATGIISGLAPALHSSAKTQSQALRSSSKGAGVGLGNRRFHAVLMVFEITLSLILLTGAGLAIKGFVKMQQQRLGYDPGGVLTFLLPLEDTYTSWSARRTFFEHVLSELERIPGVTTASMSEMGTPPFNGWNTTISFDDRPANQPALVRLNLISRGYFAAVRTPLLRGRLPNEQEILSLVMSTTTPTSSHSCGPRLSMETCSCTRNVLPP